MSRTAAIVITMVLGLPILAMVAIAAVGGFNPSLLTTFLVGGVVMIFVVGAIFEIKRLLDGDGHLGSEPPHSGPTKALGITVVDTPAQPEAKTVEPARANAAVLEERGADAQIAEPQIARATEPEPIIVEHVREAEPVAIEPKGVKKLEPSAPMRIRSNPAPPRPPHRRASEKAVGPSRRPPSNAGTAPADSGTAQRRFVLRAGRWLASEKLGSEPPSGFERRHPAGCETHDHRPEWAAVTRPSPRRRRSAHAGFRGVAKTNVCEKRVPAEIVRRPS